MGGEARTLEEYVYGPDGDDRNLVAAIRAAMEQAELQEISSIRVRCQITPHGTSTTSTDWSKIFQTDSAPEAVQAAISEQLISSPSEGFSGSIRLSFEEAGRSSNRIGSYTRKLRPGVMTRGPVSLETDEEGNPINTGAGSLRSHFDDAIRPSLEMCLRFADRQVALMHGSAAMMQAFHAPPPPESADGGGGGLFPDLVRGAVGIASAAGGSQQQVNQAGQLFHQTATHGTQYLPRSDGRPPSPLPFAPAHRTPSPFRLGVQMRGYDGGSGPSLLPVREAPRQLPGPAPSNGGGALTEAQVEAWARNNPDAARRMVFKAMGEGHK